MVFTWAVGALHCGVLPACLATNLYMTLTGLPHMHSLAATATQRRQGRGGLCQYRDGWCNCWCCVSAARWSSSPPTPTQISEEVGGRCVEEARARRAGRCVETGGREVSPLREWKRWGEEGEGRGGNSGEENRTEGGCGIRG
eukprot:180513-Rhodomonas_salina.1